MQPVTDPGLLAALDGPTGASPPPGPRPVTDAATLAALDGPAAPTASRSHGGILDNIIGEGPAAAVRGFGQSLLPSAAGVAGFSAGAGAVTPASETAAAALAASGVGAPLAPVVAVGGPLLGGIAGSMGGSALGSKVQQYAADHLPAGVVDALGMSKATQARDEANHPDARFAGELGAQVPFFRPGWVGKVPAAIGAALGGGLEGERQIEDGKLDPAKLAMATGAGALLQRPTRLGARFMPGHPAAPRPVDDPATIAALDDTPLAPPAATGGTFDRMVGAESGGHQFDRSGQPLTSGKGAVGIAQVMPTTAPEAARLAGLPWDEARYQGDPAYNRALGRAYFDHLTAQFDGDETKAAAAYNAGAGRVRRAVKAGGDDWVAHLPAETQAYVAKVRPNARSPVEVARAEPMPRGPVPDTMPMPDAMPEAMPAFDDPIGPPSAPEPAPAADAPVDTAPPAAPADAPAAPAEQVVTSRGRQVDTQPMAVEADDLITSDHPSFDQSLQPRDRAGRVTSGTDIARMAGNLDPARLGPSRLAENGAPIVGEDGQVEAGNGRVAAIRAAYEQHPEKAAAYRAMVEAADPAAASMKNPVLIRRRTTPMDPAARQAFVREANETGVMRMSGAEQASADAAALPDEALAKYRGGSVTLAANRDFVRAYMQHAIPPGEHNAMVAADGALSADGASRIRRGLLAKAYGDADLVSRIAEDTDTNIKAIGGALTDAAPAMAKLKADIAAGKVDPALDIAPYIGDAARLVSKARDEGRRLGDMLAQGDAFAPPTNPLVDGVLRLMFNDAGLLKPRAGEKLTRALEFYADEARERSAVANNGPDLLGQEPPRPEAKGLLDEARNQVAEASAPAQADLLARGDRADPAGRSVLPDAIADPAGQRDAERVEPPAAAKPGDDGAVAVGGEPGQRDVPGRPDAGDTTSAELDASPGLTLYANPIGDPKQWGKLIGSVVDTKEAGDTISRLTTALRGTTARDVLAKATKVPVAAWEGVGWMRPVAAAFYSNDGRLRGLASRFRSPAFKELADHFSSRAGAADETARDYHTAVSMTVNKHMAEAIHTLRPFAADKEAMSNIYAAMARTAGEGRATPAERAAADALAAKMRELLDYRRAAGEDIGEVADGYVKRVFDPEAIVRDKDGFIAKATRAYIAAEEAPKDAAAMAQALFTGIFDGHAGVDGKLLDFTTGRTLGGQSHKARTFGKEADALLADYYQRDPYKMMASYIAESAKRAEFTRRFGAKGAVDSPERAAWVAEHGDRTQLEVLRDRMHDDILASGKPPVDALSITDTVLRSNLGILGKVDPSIRTAVSWFHAWNILGKMSRSLITGVNHLAVGFERTGSVTDGFRNIANTTVEFARQVAKMPPSEAQHYAEALGLCSDVFAQQSFNASSGVEMTSESANRLTTRFLGSIGLAQLYESARITSTKLGMRYVHTLARDLGSTDARTAARARFYLSELGVKDHAGFGKFVLDNQGSPPLTDIRGDAGRTAEWNTAVARFVNDTALMPSRADKPTWAGHPVGGLFFGLMSFHYGMAKRVLERMGRTAALSVGMKDPLMAASALVGTTALLGMSQALTMLRTQIYGSNYDFEHETPTAMTLRLIENSGLAGGLSPIVNAVAGVRYRRSLIDSLAGPVIGTISDSATKLIALGQAHSGDATPAAKSTADRNAAAAVYDLTLAPALDGMAATYLKGPAALAAIASNSSSGKGVVPSAKEAFVDRVAGPKTTAARGRGVSSGKSGWGASKPAGW